MSSIIPFLGNLSVVVLIFINSEFGIRNFAKHFVLRFVFCVGVVLWALVRRGRLTLRILMIRVTFC
jgi:hypothetical protein